MVRTVPRSSSRRSLAHRARRPLAAVAAGVIVGWCGPAPAGAVVAPGCVPDGSVAIGVEAPELALAGADLGVTLVAIDSCGEIDPTFTGTVSVQTEQIDGRSAPGVRETFTPGDGGVVATALRIPTQGLTYVDVDDISGGTGLLGSTTVLAHGPQLYPVLEALEIDTTGGTYDVSGVTANPRNPRVPVQVEIRVDGTLVSAGPADSPFDGWAAAPVSIGDAHGFSRSVTVPSGTHTVCLALDGITVECRQVAGAGPTPAPTTPFGWYDGLYPTPTGFVASGWAIDPGRGGGTASITFTSQVRLPGAGQPSSRSWPVSEAVIPRPDVASVHPGFGSAHGFQSVGDDYPEGSTIEICAGVTGSTTLGCRSGVMRHDPLGSLDAVTAGPTGVTVSGWTLDLDSYGPTTVHVYVDGRPAEILTADGLREDIGALFPSAPGGYLPGYGPEHGYAYTLALSAGPHTVCTYGINLAAYPAQGGSNSLLGCRAVVVLSADPIGRVDGAAPAPGGFTLRGWTADPDAPTSPLQVHTYRDGTGAAITTADATRPDLAALDGGRYGTDHGFTTGTITTGATARLCSYAINTGPGSNTTLGCQDLTRPLTPTGALDETTRTSPTTATVRGWALDPDTAAPVDVHVYVDARYAGSTTASSTRGDIAAAFPSWGPAHGYTLTVPATPGQRVCTYAINTLRGTTNTTLGCRTT